MVKQTDPFNEPPSGQPSATEGFFFVLGIFGAAFGLALACRVLS
jgi:hypothetical protein